MAIQSTFSAASARGYGFKNALAAFTPLSLFSGGVQGAWYDPSDLSTMFEDSAGTTAVHTPGNGTADSPVGKILDKSGNGNHATQSTSTKRPTLSARYNLLTYTEDFSTGWTTANSTVVTNQTTAPDGTSTADFFKETVSNTNHIVYQPCAIATSANYTASFCAKVNTRSFVGVQLYNTGNSAGFTAVFDLVNGTVTGTYTRGAPVNTSSSITNLGNGWYRCTVATDIAAGATAYPQIGISNSGTPNVSDGAMPTYTGDGTSGIYIWGADLRVSNDGVGLPAYQRVVDANTYDSAGFPYYLKFDGVDDELIPATIDRTSWTGGLCVTGSRALGGQGAIVSGLSGSNLRTHEPYLDGLWYCSFGSDIRSQINIEVGVSPFNKTYVLRRSRVSGTTNFAGNGVLNVTSNTGSTTFSGPESFTIGSATYGGAISYNGRIYGVIVSGATPTGVQITNTESWMNGKTKAY